MFWEEHDRREEERRRAAVAHREAVQRLQQDGGKKRDNKAREYLKSQHLLAEDWEPQQLAQPNTLPPIKKEKQQEIVQQAPLKSAPISGKPMDIVGDQTAVVKTLYEELLNERKARILLESELQQQKSLLSSISLQLEHMKDFEASAGRSSQSKLEQQLQTVLDAQKEQQVKIERYEAAIKELNSEVSNKALFVNQEKRALEEKLQTAVKEVHQMKARMEQFNIESIQADKELFFRTRELEAATSSESQIKDKVKELEARLKQFIQDSTSAPAQLEERLTHSVNVALERLEGEISQREAFQKNIELAYADIKQVLLMQEKESVRRFESLREKVQRFGDNELQFLDKQMGSLVERMKRLEEESIGLPQKHKDEKHQLQTQLMTLQQGIAEEFKTIKQHEKQFKREIELLSQARLSDKQELLDIQEKMSSDIRNEVQNKLWKRFEETVFSLDQSNKAEQQRFEKLVQREAASRVSMEQQLKSWLSSHLETVQVGVLSTLDSKTKSILQNQASVSKRLEDHLKADIERAVSQLKVNDIQPLITVLQEERRRFSELQQNVQSFENHVRQSVHDNREKVYSISQIVEHLSQHQSPIPDSSALSSLGNRIEDLEKAIRMNGGNGSGHDEQSLMKLAHLEKSLTQVQNELQLRVLKDDYEQSLKFLERTQDNRMQILRDLIQKITENFARVQIEQGEQQKRQHDQLLDSFERYERIRHALIQLEALQKDINERLQRFSTVTVEEVLPKMKVHSENIHRLQTSFTDTFQARLSALHAELAELKSSLAHQFSPQLAQTKADVNNLTLQLGLKVEQLYSEFNQMRIHLNHMEDSFKLQSATERGYFSPELELDEIHSWREDTQNRLQRLERQLSVIPEEGSYEPSVQSHTRHETELTAVPDDDRLELDHIQEEEIPLDFPRNDEIRKSEEKYLNDIEKIFKNADKLLRENSHTSIDDFLAKQEQAKAQEVPIADPGDPKMRGIRAKLLLAEERAKPDHFKSQTLQAHPVEESSSPNKWKSNPALVPSPEMQPQPQETAKKDQSGSKSQLKQSVTQLGSTTGEFSDETTREAPRQQQIASTSQLKQSSKQLGSTKSIDRPLSSDEQNAPKQEKKTRKSPLGESSLNLGSSKAPERIADEEGAQKEAPVAQLQRAPSTQVNATSLKNLDKSGTSAMTIDTKLTNKLNQQVDLSSSQKDLRQPLPVAAAKSRSQLASTRNIASGSKQNIQQQEQPQEYQVVSRPQENSSRRNISGDQVQKSEDQPPRLSEIN